MKNSKISWCHHTVNFWWGCTKVSPACAACYALAMARVWRAKEVSWGVGGRRWLRHEKAGEELHALARAAAARGVRERVFINSMSDTFEDHASLADAREYLFTRLEEVGYALDVILLTKRPENIRRMVPAGWLQAWPHHVWTGATAEDQPRWDERAVSLQLVPAAVRFFSVEPMLGGIVPGDWVPEWAIIGGESGATARPFDVDQALSLAETLRARGTKVFVKQLGRRPVTTNANLLDWPGNIRGIESYGEAFAGARYLLNDREGRDPDEWPDELWLREFPETKNR